MNVEGFTCKSLIDCTQLAEEDRFNSLLGFKEFIHLKSGLRVLIADIASPLYSMSVVVPTFLNDNKGKAHTLEHLIFTGSEKYPERGLLDKLATSCLSNGTNAYTSDDHTNYLVTCASGRGLLKLLPVFLDHILYPTITPETVDMEVFSLKRVEANGSGNSITTSASDTTSASPSTISPISAQGVVYCEMKARQHSEADLMDFWLRRGVCSQPDAHAELKRFAFECGGLTPEIAELTLEEIVAFHRQFYEPAKMTIILGGRIDEKLTEELLLAISSSVKTGTSSNDDQSAITYTTPTTHYQVPAMIPFPADDPSLGSVGLAWSGPEAHDLLSVLSYHVLFKLLRETSSSPLHQALVQVAEPWATEIDYEIKPFFSTIMTLIFSGVPVKKGLEAGKIAELVRGVIEQLLSDPSALMKALQLTLKSFELKMTELLEDDPHEIVSSYTIPNLTLAAILPERNNSVAFGANICQLKGIIRDLKGKTVEYWTELLQLFITAQPVEVILSPDLQMNERIEQEERVLLTKLAEDGRVRFCDPESAVQKIQRVVDCGVELMTDASMAPFSRAGQVINLPTTGMKTMAWLSNFKTAVPQQLWPLLPLFQELLFQCDVQLDSKWSKLLGLPQHQQQMQQTIPYQSLQKALNAHFNSYCISFGLENEIFSLGYCEEAQLLSAVLPEDSTLSLEDAAELLKAVLKGTQFTAERVKIVAENLSNQIKDLQKDAYEIIDAVLTNELHSLRQGSLEANKRAKLEHSGVFETEISIFKQKGLLKRIIESEEEVESVLSALRQIQGAISFDPAFIQCGGHSRVMSKESSPLITQSVSDPSSLFDLKALPKFGNLKVDGPVAVAYPLGDITASYLSCVLPCNILPSSSAASNASNASLKEYASISLLCHLLSITEGPIYSKIRGRGLAYGASLTVSLWNGLLTFAVDDSTGPAEAFSVFRELVQEVDGCFSNSSSSDSLINEEALKVAKSALIFQLIEERSTPSSLQTVLLRASLRSIPVPQSSNASDPVLSCISACQVSDLKAAWLKYFTPLKAMEGLLMVLVTPRAGAEAIVKEFEEKCGIGFELKSARDYCEVDDESEDEESDGDDEDEDEDESEHDSEDCTIDNTDASTD